MHCACHLHVRHVVLRDRCQLAACGPTVPWLWLTDLLHAWGGYHPHWTRSTTSVHWTGYKRCAMALQSICAGHRCILGSAHRSEEEQPCTAASKEQSVSIGLLPAAAAEMACPSCHCGSWSVGFRRVRHCTLLRSQNPHTVQCVHTLMHINATHHTTHAVDTMLYIAT